MMKYIQIEGFENYPATVYTDRGRFFVDFHDTATDRNGNRYPLPVGSYETIDGVREALSYHYEGMKPLPVGFNFDGNEITRYYFWDQRRKEGEAV